MAQTIRVTLTALAEGALNTEDLWAYAADLDSGAVTPPVLPEPNEEGVL